MGTIVLEGQRTLCRKWFFCSLGSSGLVASTLPAEPFYWSSPRDFGLKQRAVLLNVKNKTWQHSLTMFFNMLNA